MNSLKKELIYLIPESASEQEKECALNALSDECELSVQDRYEIVKRVIDPDSRRCARGSFWAIVKDFMLIRSAFYGSDERQDKYATHLREWRKRDYVTGKAYPPQHLYIGEKD